MAAVQAAAEVPDIVDLQAAQVNGYYKNGTVQDLTESAKAQPWYAKMDESTLKLCSGPDGRLLLHPHGHAAVVGLRLEGSLPQWLPQDH